jgi:hypothetical protein
MLTKLFICLTVVAGAFVAQALSQPWDVPPAVNGQYLELRSAAVFAGACHVNSERDHQGRRALLAFQLEGGRFLDEPLEGVDLVVAVASDANLDEGAPRRSVVYVDESLPQRRRAEALGWLEAVHGDRLGEVQEVIATTIDLDIGADSFALEIPGVAVAAGETLADEACCSMPESRWYEPLAGPDATMVGNASRCRFEGAAGISAWAYEDQNNAFVGSFDELTERPCGLPLADDDIISCELAEAVETASCCESLPPRFPTTDS